MFKLKLKNNISIQLQNILREHKWMFFIFILWAVTYIAISEGVLTQKRTITVTGSSMNAAKNELANFNITLSSNNADKEKAVEETNSRSTNILDAVKSFGIPEEDVQTTNMSIYQQQDYINYKYVDGDWFASITIDITLRDVEKATALTDLLSSLDIDNFYGPNYSVDTFSLDETALLNAAIEDAHAKALTVATAMNKELGGMLSFTEDTVASGFYPLRDAAVGLGGGASLMPGTSDVSKTVVVTYRVR